MPQTTYDKIDRAILERLQTDGRIAKIWRNVRVDGHADEVLAAARELAR